MTPKDRALEHGAHVLSLEELLSLVVEDANIARQLAAGGVGQLFRLREHELAERFGREAAVKVVACCDLVCRLQEHNLDSCHPAWYFKDLAELIRSRYGKLGRELYGAFFFDAASRPLAHDLIFEQEIDGWGHETRQVMRHALAHGAASILVFCYRPARDWGARRISFPSDLALAAGQLDLEFCDYLEVLANGNWRSAKEERQLERSGGKKPLW